MAVCEALDSGFWWCFHDLRALGAGAGGAAAAVDALLHNGNLQWGHSPKTDPQSPEFF
jgi:hypothetical protein